MSKTEIFIREWRILMLYLFIRKVQKTNKTWRTVIYKIFAKNVFNRIQYTAVSAQLREQIRYRSAFITMDHIQALREIIILIIYKK